MSRRVFALLLIILGLTLTAQSADAQKRPRGDRNRLTRVELDEAGVSISTARDAVRVLRPQWLSPPLGRRSNTYMGGRDPAADTTGAPPMEPMAGLGSAASEVVVYIDGIRQSDLESLVTVSVAQLVEMRYLDQNRAVQMHGPGHEMGVIEVTTVAKKK